MVILILFAVLSGLVTVLSPCILPVLPIVLASSVAGGKRRPLGVIAGLIVSFSVFTLAIAKVVSLLGLSANTLRLAAVVILAVLGLTLVVPALSAWMEKALSRLPGMVKQGGSQGSGFGAGLLTGASLGLVWAPCAGPILAAVTTLAATRAVNAGVALVIVAYAIGAGIPLLAIAYGGRSLIQRVSFLKRNTLRLQQTFGAIMVLTAVLIAFNADTLVTTYLTAMVPASWTAQLSGFESSAVVAKQLSQLRAGAVPAKAAPAPGGNPVMPGFTNPNLPTAVALASQDTGAPAVTATSAPMSVPTETPMSVASSNPVNVASSNPTSPAPVKVDLPDLGPAPELTGISHWINSQPLTIQGLKGKVVLIDFWTYSCINCIRTLPYVTDWYNKYKDQGLVVIGVHSPEFAFEHDTSNVEQATKRFNITYPVAQDNDLATWNAFNNMYWPAEYLIDAKGRIRHTQFGEGDYDKSEMAIQELLAEVGHPENATLTNGPTVNFSDMQTPETYIGTDRQQSFASPEPVTMGGDANYTYPGTLILNYFAMSGWWNFRPEYAQVDGQGGKLELHFAAKDAYLVMSSDKPATVTVKLADPGQVNSSEDIDAQGQITVNAARLYHIVGFDKMQEGTVELQFSQPGVRVYAFTFGG